MCSLSGDDSLRRNANNTNAIPIGVACYERLLVERSPHSHVGHIGDERNVKSNVRK